MEDKKLGRREFLKLTIASAAAAGLSHFQFLNFGGGALLAQEGPCHAGTEDPDVCDATNDDDCNTFDPDYCPDPSPAALDLCAADPYTSGSDACIPGEEPDVCALGEDPDICFDTIGDGDQEACTQGDPDVCQPPQNDQCEAGTNNEPDTCVSPYTGTNSDVCEPLPGEEDTCDPATDNNFDQCPAPAPQGEDPDICLPEAPYDPDKCMPLYDPDECTQEPDPDEATAVDLASFGAYWTGQGVAVEWETASEIDNLGFNVYRAGSTGSPQTRLNDSLIPAQAPGSAVGAAYTFLDQGMAAGVYYYWLEDVDVYGLATRQGPVSVEVAPRRRLVPARPRPAPGSPRLRGR